MITISKSPLIKWRCPACNRSWKVREYNFPFVCSCGARSDHPGQPRLPVWDGADPIGQPCIHKGEFVRRELCTSCSGNVEIKIFECAKHELCTIGASNGKGRQSGVACCLDCKDYERPPFTLEDITIVAVSFLRFDCLKRLLTSIRFNYPGMNVVIADQSAQHATGEDYEFCRAFPNVKWVDLPYDSGISVCRNAAIQEVKTKLVLLLDDDHILSHESPIAALLDVLNSDREIKLVCGVIRQASTPGHSVNACHWHADFENNGDGVLHAVPLKRKWAHSRGGYWYKRLDRYINCFLAPKKLLTDLPWNEVHKIAGEHLDHVLLLYNSGVKCAYTPNFIVGELPTTNLSYGRLRSRNSEHWAKSRWKIETKEGSWKTELEPGIPRKASVVPSLSVPNIILLTVGHTGSSVIAGLFAVMGWHIPDCDPEFNEPETVRNINQMIRSGDMIEQLQKFVAELPRPWILKDPRFTETLEYWLPALANHKPLLLYLSRDAKDVAESWTRRGESLEHLAQRQALADKAYQYWPWAKTKLQYEDIGEWASRWSPRQDQLSVTGLPE